MQKYYGAGPFIRSFERLCKHDGLGYAGAFSVRDLDGLASFITPEAEAGARAFARELLAVQN